MPRHFANDVPKDWVPITPDDDTDLDGIMSLYVFGAGTLSVVTADGNIRNLPTVQANWEFKCQVKRVRSTGTTASNIWGMK